MRRFEMTVFLRSIERFRVSDIWIVPPVLVAMPPCVSNKAADISSLRQVWVGGASIQHSTYLSLHRILHSSAAIKAVWGMTECGWVTTGLFSENMESAVVGRPLRDFQVRVDTPDDGSNGCIGEILVKGNHMMLRYLGQEKSPFDQDGFFRTGDAGKFDEGLVHVLDRQKDMIKVRGWQVSPAELEAVLMQHPGIKDAAVIGVVDGFDEAPLAFIVPSEGVCLEFEALQTWMKTFLARYKVPKSFQFIDAIPKNTTGKILRRLLRDRVETQDSKSSNGSLVKS